MKKLKFWIWRCFAFPAELVFVYSHPGFSALQTEREIQSWKSSKDFFQSQNLLDIRYEVWSYSVWKIKIGFFKHSFRVWFNLNQGLFPLFGATYFRSVRFSVSCPALSSSVQQFLFWKHLQSVQCGLWNCVSRFEFEKCLLDKIDAIYIL